MRNSLSRRGVHARMPEAQLNAIWFVDADSSYIVERRPGQAQSKYVAVRTLTGSAKLRLHDGSTFDPDAGSLLLLRANDVTYYAADAGGWQFYWFEFDACRIPDARLNCLLSQNMSAQERIELERCFDCLGSNVPERCAFADSLFGYLLSGWLLEAAGAGGDCETLQIPALLEQGRREKLSVVEMARRMGMCERSFRDAAQRITGMSPKAYMLRGEMEAAMELLRTSNMSISEIAACFDYASPFYFSRVFSRYYGMSPRHVRDNIEL